MIIFGRNVVEKLCCQMLICLSTLSITNVSALSGKDADQQKLHLPNVVLMFCQSSTSHCLISSILLTCNLYFHTHTHTTHARLTTLCPGLPRWASTRKVKPIWILLKQETVGGSGISWAIMQVCTSLQTDNHASTPPLLCFFTGQMPFLPPNQQRQSTEGNLSKIYQWN